MRPGQQNRRPRGRTNNNGGSNNSNNNGNNNNRGRQQNPLARSYESSGPDVKIRGNAQHIAERYAQLARDSLSSGDRVMAENYLQHAEHYNRIIAAAMLQQAQFSEQQRREWDEEGGTEGEGEEGDDNANAEVSGENGQPVNGQNEQPPHADGIQQSSNPNQNRDRNGFQNRPERQSRQDRGEHTRNNQDRNSPDRVAQDRGERPERQPRAIFVAPLDDSQPVIEGTPAEFANAESAGLARTLGIAPVEAVADQQSLTEAESVAIATQETAPRVARPRRAPRKVADDAPVAEIAEPAGE